MLPRNTAMGRLSARMGGLFEEAAVGVERVDGVGEIRTHEGVTPLAVFKTAAFNHSATTPGPEI